MTAITTGTWSEALGARTWPDDFVDPYCPHCHGHAMIRGNVHWENGYDFAYWKAPDRICECVGTLTVTISDWEPTGWVRFVGYRWPDVGQSLGSARPGYHLMVEQRHLSTEHTDRDGILDYVGTATQTREVIW
jgi:hypothetical protein